MKKHSMRKVHRSLEQTGKCRDGALPEESREGNSRIDVCKDAGRPLPRLLNKATVSVIIPVYNKEKYVANCINSVLNQTCRDIQIIIVDDASSDRSLSIINEMANADARCLVIHFEANQGAALARNAGLDNATGKYVCFVDADDWLEEHALEIAAANIEKLGVDIVQFGNNSIDDKGIYFKHSEPARQTSDKKQILQDLAATKITYLVWNKIYSREFINRHRIRFPNIRPLEDGVFVSDCVFNLGKIAFIPDILYNYRHYPSSYSTQDIDRNYLDAMFFILDHYERSNRTLRMLSENVDLKNQLLKKYLLWLVEVLGRKRPQGSNKAINQSELYDAIHKYFPENAMVVFSLIDIIVNDYKQKENLNNYASVVRLAKHKLIDKFLKNKDERILIYGTGRIAKNLCCALNWFGYCVAGFIESGKTRDVDNIFLVPVFLVSQIKKANFTKIVVAADNNVEFCAVLDKLDYRKDEDYLNFEWDA